MSLALAFSQRNSSPASRRRSRARAGTRRAAAIAVATRSQLGAVMASSRPAHHVAPASRWLRSRRRCRRRRAYIPTRRGPRRDLYAETLRPRAAAHTHAIRRSPAVGRVTRECACAHGQAPDLAAYMLALAVLDSPRRRLRRLNAGARRHASGRRNNARVPTLDDMLGPPQQRLRADARLDRRESLRVGAPGAGSERSGPETAIDRLLSV